MLRGGVSLFLCAVLVFPWASRVAIAVDFVIRQDHIAQNLCENREEPELHCNGKCVLMKKLNMAKEDNEKPQRLPEILQREIPHFLVQNLDFALPVVADAYSAHQRVYLSGEISNVFLHDIFHPPRFLV